MSPLGLQIPAEVVNALRTLPLLGDRLKEVASHTRVLGGVSKDVGAIAVDVGSVPRIEEAVAAIARDTQTLPEIAPAIAGLAERIGGLEARMAVLPKIDGRMATIEDAMPVLVEVQQHLAALPETMQSLDAKIGGLTDLLTQLVASLGNLDANVAALQVSMEPVGRLADKLPGGSRRS